MAKDYIKNRSDNSILKQVDIDGIEKKIQNLDYTSYFSTEKIIEYASKVIGVFGVIFNIFVTIIISIYIILPFIIN